jgi:poly-gamma-glutamate capsule biosynthesis protein CapA/YwtB (metallophosphatase superfamily)
LLLRTEVHRTRRKKNSNKLTGILVSLGIIVIIIAAALVIWNIYSTLSNQQDENSSSKDTEDIQAVNDSEETEPAKDIADQETDKVQEAELNLDHVKLSFVGDIMLGSKVDNLLQDHGYDYPYLYVQEYLRQADLSFANLETPISEQGEPEDKEYAYRTSPKALPEFAESGIDIVNLANNHILDYGLTGMLDTFKYLDETGIKYVGAGNDAEEAYTPVILEKNGMKIAVFGFSQVVPELWWKADKDHPGVAETYNYTRPVEAIESVRTEADLIVVIAHWGEERNDLPVKQQVEMAHRYIDAGADLVVGGHPHVLQGLEHYNGKWIAYSLGNFIFTTNDNPKTWETIILEASCSKEGVCGIELVPVLTKWAQPKPMEAQQAAELFKRIADISVGSEVQSDGKVMKVEKTVP